MSSSSGVHYTCTPTAFSHYLHAIDINAFTEINGSPIQICQNGNICGPYTSSAQFSHDHIQRPGLLYAPKSETGLSADYVYIAFSMMDGTNFPWPNGFIVGYPADFGNETVYSYTTTQGQGTNKNSFGGGIWQGGAGPAFGIGDSNGDYFAFFGTANGTFNVTAPGNDVGDSIVKLTPKLQAGSAGWANADSR